MRMLSPHATDCTPDTNAAQGVVVELTDGVGVTLDDGSGTCHPNARLSPCTRHSANASHGRLRRRCRHGLVTGTIYVHLKQYLKRYGTGGAAPDSPCLYGVQGRARGLDTVQCSYTCPPVNRQPGETSR